MRVYRFFNLHQDWKTQSFVPLPRCSRRWRGGAVSLTAGSGAKMGDPSPGPLYVRFGPRVRASERHAELVPALVRSLRRDHERHLDGADAEHRLGSHRFEGRRCRRAPHTPVEGPTDDVLLARPGIDVLFGPGDRGTRPRPDTPLTTSRASSPKSQTSCGACVWASRSYMNVPWVASRHSFSTLAYFQPCTEVCRCSLARSCRCPAVSAAGCAGQAQISLPHRLLLGSAEGRHGWWDGETECPVRRLQCRRGRAGLGVRVRIQPRVPCCGEGKPAAMLPLIDVANHSFEASAEVRAAVGEGPGAIEMVASRPLRAGDEVTLNYGNLSNDHFLLDYGFVPQGINKHDTASLRWDVSYLEAAREVAGLAQVPFAAGTEPWQSAMLSELGLDDDPEVLVTRDERQPWMRGCSRVSESCTLQDRRISAAVEAAKRCSRFGTGRC